METIVQLQDEKTGNNVAPITHWDAVSNKPDLVTRSELSGVAQQGDNPDVSLTSVDEKIDDFYDTFDADIAEQLHTISGYNDESDSDDDSEQGTLTNTEIEGLRTLQQSYDALVDNQAIYNEGKAGLAASITAMGVQSTTSDTIAQMAAKVRQIPQVVNTAQSDFEQMIAPTPYMWNVYTVAEDLMKETLPSYIPSYMSTYRQTYGANAFFVGEYYLGYNSLELTGADGYLTNDGDFYTISGTTVTHTKPDGTTETWTDSTIIHTWHDDDTYCNRWVAFFYLNDAYSFTNTTSSICPRRVALCGTCDSFIVSGENRLTDVWVIGTLGHFEGGTTGTTWNPAQVIRNYTAHNSGYIYTNPTTLTSVLLPDLKELGSTVIGITSNIRSNVRTFCLPGPLRTLPQGRFAIANSADLIYTYINTEEIYAPAATGDSGYFECHYNAVPTSGNGKFILPNLLGIKDTATNWSSIVRFPVNIIAPKFTTFISTNRISKSSWFFYTVGNSIQASTTFIYTPALSEVGTGTFGLERNNTVFYPDLKDIWIGEIGINIDFSKWTATNVTTTAEGIATINANIRNHIAARIADMTGQTSPTITFGANLYNNLEQATKDAFTVKNWTVASA